MTEKAKSGEPENIVYVKSGEDEFTDEELQNVSGGARPKSKTIRDIDKGGGGRPDTDVGF